MTWEKLAQEILNLPAESRNEQASVFLSEIGETALIDEITKTEDCNGCSEPEFTLCIES